MTPCQRLKQKLFDLLDAEVDAANKRHIECHLKKCPDCSTFFREIKRQRECLRRLKPIRTQSHFWILLRERIRREVAGKHRSPASFSGFSIQWAAVLGLAFLFVVAAVWLSDKRLGKNNAPIVATPSQKPERKSVSHPVHYVIDDFQGVVPHQAPKRKPVTPARQDTAKRVSNSFQELRSRLTPVSF